MGSTRKISKDVLCDPRTAFGTLTESRCKAEVELVERYQTFVAELLRLSMAGIAVFGFLYRNLFHNTNSDSIAGEIVVYAKMLSAFAVIMFAMSMAFALVFRFCATQGARFYIQALRFTPGEVEPEEKSQNTLHVDWNRAQESLNTRYKYIIACRWSKLLAALALGSGGFLMAIALCLLLTESSDLTITMSWSSAAVIVLFIFVIILNIESQKRKALSDQ